MPFRASAAVVTEEPVARAAPRQTLRLVSPPSPAASSGAPTLQDFIDVTGASGQRYRFGRLRAGFPLSPVGGTYLLARHSECGLSMLYIAAAESLMREAGQLWRDAAETLQANQLFSRLNASGRTRDCELADILAAPRTPLRLLPSAEV